MSDLDLVYGVVEAVVESSEEGRIEALAGIIERCLSNAMAHSYAVESEKGHRYSSDMENAEVLERINTLATEAQELAASTLDPATAPAKSEVSRRFKEIIKETMLIRRGTYPLVADSPFSEPPTVEEALEDDDDMISFTICDSLMEELDELADPMYALASAGDAPVDPDNDWLDDIDDDGQAIETEGMDEEDVELYAECGATADPADYYFNVFSVPAGFCPLYAVVTPKKFYDENKYQFDQHITAEAGGLLDLAPEYSEITEGSIEAQDPAATEASIRADLLARGFEENLNL